jgi:ABC-type multidrug transport system fused ATPase/permease subunit
MSHYKKAKNSLQFSFFTESIAMLWNLLYGEKRRIIIVTVLLVLLTLFDLTFPYVLKLVFDEIPELIKKREISTILYCLLGGVVVVKFVSLFINHFVKERIFLKAIIGLENFWPVLAQKKLLALSLSYHERENTGKKIAKINKGCEKMLDIVGNLFWIFFPQLFYLIINAIVILVLDWRLGLLFFVPLCIATRVNLKYYMKLIPKWELWEKKKELSIGYFCQPLINVNTVQNFVKEKNEIERFASVRREMEEFDIDFSYQIQKYFFVIGSILQISFVSMILCGLYFVSVGEIPPGTVVYVVATGNVTVQGFFNLIQSYSRIMRNFVAVVRMKELLDEKEDTLNMPEAFIPESFHGHFRFKNTRFSYKENGNEVLQGVSLRVNPNEMVALVGHSGGGKTTIMRLLARMSDVTKGDVLLDGIDIREFTRDWYRSLFAIVSQNVDVFDDTIRANVAYAYPEADDAEIFESLRAAHLGVVLEDTDKFHKGVMTHVGDRGVRLSGGERQRLGIARALIALNHGAKVLLLDEATSNLDSESERAIQDVIGLIRKTTNVSIVVIAHRLSTICRADRIYVIEEGKVAEEGDHNRLLERNGLYARLVELQQLGEIRE